jgi:DNA-directed RNA polymerase subunit K/omega
MSNEPETNFYADPKGLLENREYNYLMVNAIAKRVRGLQTGKTPTVLRTGDVLETAKQEFLADQLVVVPDQEIQEVLEATRLEEERALAASRLLLDLEADSE